ncbi:MAG: methyl-accepting chemotaxis protein [Tissierellia bacterium]|nr:methyl-accepting chemotaxis protein [Tissierellia bacterium]
MRFTFKKIKLPKFKKKKKEKKLVENERVKSISKSMMLSTTSILIGLTLVLGIVTYFISKNELIKTNEELLLNKATDSATIVDEQIKSNTLSITTLGNLEAISNPDIPDEEKLKMLKEERGKLNFSSIGIANLQGELLLENGVVLDIYEEEYFRKAYSGSSYFSEPFVNNLTGKLEVAIAAPIKYKGVNLGVVVGFKPAEDFYRIAENIKIGEKGFAYILNDSADIISHPTVATHATNGKAKADVNFSALKKQVPSNYIDEIVKMEEKIVKGKAGIGKYMENGEIIHLGFAPIKSKDWTLVVNISESEILSGLNYMKKALILAMLVAIIIGIIFSILFSKSLTKPIVHATNQAYNLSQLDFSEDVDEKLIMRKDELGKLAYSLQVVIDNMRNFAKEIQESSHQVAAASEELAAISQQSTAAATNIAENSSEIAEGSSNQLDEIINITSSIKEISSQIEHVSRQTSNAEDVNRDVFQKTEVGKENMDEVTIQMRNIQDSTNSVKSSLDNISSSSNEMNQMLEIIQDIAEQTNLLALNAAIEAARAGEYGRGFAVVAEEIRKLAEETQKSTEKIYLLLVNNNVLIEEANAKMDYSSKEVELGVTRVNEAKETFDEISKLIVQIGYAVNEVVAAIGNVESYVDSLVHSSTSIENMSKEIAAQIQNSSAASQEQMASMEEITSSTESLAKLAEELQMLIGNIRF